MSGRGLAVAFSIVASSLACAPASAQHVVQVYVPTADYPSGVRPDGSEHRVRLDYELGPSGRAVNCTILRPSRQPALDAESCHIVLARVRIRPHPDRLRGSMDFIWLGVDSLGAVRTRGEPLNYDLVRQINSHDYPADAGGRSGVVTYAATVSPFGQPIGCTITESSGVPALDRRTCDIIMARTMYIPATDGTSFITAVSHGRIRWER